MDAIFAKVEGWKGWFTVVHQAKVEPRWYGNKGELLVDLEHMNVHHKNEERSGGAEDGIAPQIKAVMEEGESSSQDGGRAQKGLRSKSRRCSMELSICGCGHL